MSDERELEVVEYLKTQPEPVACDEGLTLLARFSLGSPSLYELAERVSFVDPIHPAFKTNALWLAFARHCSACEKCSEV